MAILDDVKVALRITHTKLDSEITAKIAAARKEMIRLGIAETAANGDDVLIVEAIKTYVARGFADDPNEVKTLDNSWTTQVDGLRKSSDYKEE